MELVELDEITLEGHIHEIMEPFRAELYNTEQLWALGKNEGSYHRLLKKKVRIKLLDGLEENAELLSDVYAILQNAIEKHQVVNPAGIWLLDNYYILLQQVEGLEQDLTREYLEELPQLENGLYKGIPRIYQIVLELISHTDSKIDRLNIESIIRGYQDVQPLKLGELWAIPLLLRLALVENVKRIAAEVGQARLEYDEADKWVENLKEVAQSDPRKLIVQMAELARQEKVLGSTFVSEVVNQLRAIGMDMVIDWLDYYLTSQGTSIEELQQEETQNQAENRISIANCMTSLRLISTMDWREFIEGLSVVHEIFQSNPEDCYLQMDFITRDYYRHRVEKIAKNHDLAEVDVALVAVELSKKAQKIQETSDRMTHLGYYLIDEGKSQLLAELDANPKIKERGSRFFRNHALFFYISGILAITGVIEFWLVRYLLVTTNNLLLFALIFPVSLFCVFHASVELINYFSTTSMNPTFIPKMNFKYRIPDRARTLVAIAMLIFNKDQVSEQIKQLETIYLSNRGSHLHFCLLTDLPDADQEITDEEQDLIEFAKKRIEALNKKYSENRTNIFYLFHRKREFNPVEKKWMGWERKRGGILDLFRFIAKKDEKWREKFHTIVGEQSLIHQIKYAIMLDMDTFLPFNSAKQLIGAMEHPLNQPRFDQDLGRVTKGYGILQPTVLVNYSDSKDSRYLRLFEGETGLDPYSTLIANVYQDVFGEGSFIGKGIYNVKIFLEANEKRFPENLILSHDLIEGGYARSGLISDIKIYEDAPSNYLADAFRIHRWIRGDWQICGWLGRKTKNSEGETKKNHLSALYKWKVTDNLRRSLLPLGFLIFMLFSWFFSTSPLIWALIILGLFFSPQILSSLNVILKRERKMNFRSHLRKLKKKIPEIWTAGLIKFILIPFEAYFYLDAIIRSVWRMKLSHKKLLEWKTFHETRKKRNSKMFYFIRRMWFPPLLSTLVFLVFFIFIPPVLIISVPFLLIWFLSPVIMYALSKPIPETQYDFSTRDEQFLRSVARKTWRFFETFVNADSNWLPPDNFQETPVSAVARRTSPTNIGLCLLTTYAAYEFGYIPLKELLGRIDNSFDTINKLEKYRGHLFNWYDIDRLSVLHPAYVSTVDSGNFIGSLLTLREGLRNLKRDPIRPYRMSQGLLDTLFILKSTIEEHQSSNNLNLGNELSAIEEIEELIGASPQSYSEALSVLSKLDSIIEESIAFSNPDQSAELSYWRSTFVEEESECKSEMEQFFSWIIPFLEILDYLRDRLNVAVINSSEDPELVRLYRVYLEFSERIADWISPKYILESRKDILAFLEALKKRQLFEGLLDEMADYDAKLVLFQDQFTRACDTIRSDFDKIDRMTRACVEMSEIEHQFLVSKDTNLFSIGFRVDQHLLDSGSYDLLASEARLAIFVAIALGFVGIEHWFALSRQLVAKDGKIALVSWSGTMFEYLMPMLFMPSFKNSLIEISNRNVVEYQIRYGRQHGVPWGVSESGYNLTDADGNYQYRAFGVPELGIKRGLENDLVISPYSTALALLVNPQKALTNLKELYSLGFHGRFGFKEAVDYTRSRLPPKKKHQVLNSYMAHHQGMIFLALANSLLDRGLPEIFEQEPHFQSALLLLQERVPADISRIPPEYMKSKLAEEDTKEKSWARVFTTASTVVPEVNLLSNGNYHVVINNAGAGYSAFEGISITRWREDSCQDHWGFFCYIKDLTGGEFGSNTYQPTLKKSDNYKAVFSASTAEFFNAIGKLGIHTTVAISPEDNLELRRIEITNNSNSTRRIRLASYIEIVLSTPAQDRGHPAFNKMFVETETFPELNLVVAKRRPRNSGESFPVIFHSLKVHGKEPAHISFETDRAKFLGRARNLEKPHEVFNEERLSNTEGYVLDPILSISPIIDLAPNEDLIVDLFLGISPNLIDALSVCDSYKNRHISDRIFDLAWASDQMLMRKLDVTENQISVFIHLASSVLYINSSARANASTILKNDLAQDSLWALNISGDLPLVMIFIRDDHGIDFVKEVAAAYRYLRYKGLDLDLVIINQVYGGYRQVLNEQIHAIADPINQEDIRGAGRTFVFKWEILSEEHKILLQAAARVILKSDEGPLEDQVKFRRMVEILPRKIKQIPAYPTKTGYVEMPFRELTDFNGYGGFTPDGKEYVTFILRNRPTPKPWVNVLANPNFGTVTSESGGGYTWYENAHEFRLTPWYNDWVADSSGEAFYLRDDDSGKAWSLTPLPRPGKNYYACHHGQGYTKYEYSEDGLETELRVFVDLHSPVKNFLVKVRNNSNRRRAISFYGYIEWVMGDDRINTCLHLQMKPDVESGAILVKNPYNREMPSKVAFFTTSRRKKTFTADRIEFIGRNRNLEHPKALERVKLSNRAGAGIDPCSAIQVPLQLNPGEEQQVLFAMGCGMDESKAKDLAHRCNVENAERTLEQIWKYWSETLGVLYLETPNGHLNNLANYWLLHQVISCRLWGRSSFYQSGGAFGFRDQLQDVMALVHTRPQLIREQILKCASRQFVEGDVQHWWHPPVGRGVRTKFSDDYLWLPFVTLYYMKNMKDTGVLEEQVPYIEGRQLNPEEESYFDLPNQSSEVETIYDHCKRAIKYGLKFGSHGLPLMGSGDWNDGMNLVGKDEGESVWLAFFLVKILEDFSELAKERKDEDFVTICVTNAQKIKNNIKKHAWDGNWYIRAFFGDGTPLGSKVNSECSIDSIAQSWATLSDMGSGEKPDAALESSYDHLVRKDARLILLLDPPFDESDLEPGYIKGYPPGIRENGGQYTHAAIWTIMAYAKRKDADKVAELWDLLDPINHGNTEFAINTYKVEPYVTCADVYSNRDHLGEGGWTWYTGSGAWMYRLIVESILGIERRGDELIFSPCIPPDWDDFKVHYRYFDTFYHITYKISEENRCNIQELLLDGEVQEKTRVPLINDKRDHDVELVLS